MTNTEPATHQRPWSESELLKRLQSQEFCFPPVVMRLLQSEFALADLPGERVDGTVEIAWQGYADRFVLEYKAQSTPKTLEGAIAQAQRYARTLGLRPLVIVPYLSEGALGLLEAKGVSGLDLSGNGVVLAPQFALRRSGVPNRFKEAVTLRNVFWGNSSLLTRCFLLRSEYASLSALGAFGRQRFRGSNETGVSPFAKGTVSKVVQSLEEENLIARRNGGLRLTGADTLLQRLKSHYRKPRGARLAGKMRFPAGEAWERLAGQPLRAVATGEASAGHYRVLSGQDKWTFYVDDLQSARRALDLTPTPLFPNVELIEETGDMVYFDARADGSILWASPVQTWLELTHSGPRERAAADELATILRKGGGETL